MDAILAQLADSLQRLGRTRDAVEPLSRSIELRKRLVENDPGHFNRRQALVREAKRRQPLQGVALSGLGMDEDILRSMEAGFDCHLTKRINFQELKSVLEKIE